MKLLKNWVLALLGIVLSSLLMVAYAIGFVCLVTAFVYCDFSWGFSILFCLVGLPILSGISEFVSAIVSGISGWLLRHVKYAAFAVILPALFMAWRCIYATWIAVHHLNMNFIVWLVFIGCVLAILYMFAKATILIIAATYTDQ